MRKNDKISDKPAKKELTGGGIAALAKKIGAVTLDKVQGTLEKGFIDTTNLALNLICSGKAYGGGIPMGRITEIFGPPAACKTAFATHIIQGCQAMGGVCLFIDSERAYSPTFAERLGINSSQLIYDDESETLEDCFAMIIKFIQAFKSSPEYAGKPGLIVYDSIASSPSKKEFDTAVKNEEDKAEVGNRAKICSAKLRTISQLLISSNVAVIVINQLRSNIGVMYGNPETTAGGGRALEYYGSLRLDVRRRKKIQKKSGERTFGIFVDIKTVKNKVHDPFWEAKNIQFFFDNGVDPLSGFIDAAMFCERFVSPTVGWIAPAAEPQNKFRKNDLESWAMKDDNFKHFDAPSKEALGALLEMNRSAREKACSEEFESVDTEEEESLDAVARLPVPEATMTGAE